MSKIYRIGNVNKRGDVLIIGPGLTLSEDVDGHPKLQAGDGGGAKPVPEAEDIALSEDVSFHASGSAGFHIRTTPSGIADISPDGTHAFDASGYREARVIGEIKRTGPQGSRVAVQYSTDDGESWAYLDGVGGPYFDVSARVGTFRSAWVALEPGAQHDIDLRLVLLNGDDASPVRFGKVVSVQFRSIVKATPNLVAPQHPEPVAPCTSSTIPAPSDCASHTVNFDGYTNDADMAADWTFVQADFPSGAMALSSSGGIDGSKAIMFTVSAGTQTFHNGSYAYLEVDVGGRSGPFTYTGQARQSPNFFGGAEENFDAGIFLLDGASAPLGADSFGFHPEYTTPDWHAMSCVGGSAGVQPPGTKLRLAVGWGFLAFTTINAPSTSFFDNLKLTSSDGQIVDPCRSGEVVTVDAPAAGSIKLPVSTGLQAWHVFPCGIGSADDTQCNATIDMDDYATTADLLADGWAHYGMASSMELDPTGGPDGRACIQLNINPIDVYFFIPGFGSRDCPRIFKTITGLTPGALYNFSAMVEFSTSLHLENTYIRLPEAHFALTPNPIDPASHTMSFNSGQVATWTWGDLYHYGEGGTGDPAPFTGQWAERWWSNFSTNPRLKLAFLADSNGEGHFKFGYGSIYGPTMAHTIRFADIKITAADGTLVCPDSFSSSSNNSGSGVGLWTDQSGHGNDLKIKACLIDDGNGPDPDEPGVIQPVPGGTIPIAPIGKRMFALWGLGVDGHPWPDVFDSTVNASGGWTPGVLADAKSKHRRIILGIGGRSKFQNSSGNYDPRLYDAYVRSIAALDIGRYITDGTVYGVITCDDIRQGQARSWPPNGLSNTEINRMCSVWKQLIPGIRTIVRSAPEIIAQQSTHIPNMDVSVAQYSARMGSVANYIEEQYAHRTRMGIPHIMWSLNVRFGGNGSSHICGGIDGDSSHVGCAMSPSEYLSYGSKFAELTDSEGMGGWTYDDRAMAQSGMINAYITVRNIMVGVPEQ